MEDKRGTVGTLLQFFGPTFLRVLFWLGQCCEGRLTQGLARAAEQKARDEDAPPQQGVVFAGSSMFTYWVTLKEDLAPSEVALVNRGFGGSRLSDLLAFTEVLVLRHRPRLVVLYCGVNDLHFGAEPEVVVEGTRMFHQKLKEALPDTKLLVLQMNLAPAHFAVGLVPKIRRAKALTAQLCQEIGCECLDLFAQDPRFATDFSFYAWDTLHLSARGYARLGELLRPALRLDSGVTLDTSGEPYTQLLVYAGNNVGLSNYSSAIPLEDGRTTCTSATYWPCARFQVLKEAPPVGCAADFCTAEECCTVAGLCWDFFAGAQNASDNATDVGPGCAEGFVARAAPPEFCAGPICSSTDCCLRRAEPVVGVQLSAGTYNSAQVLWDVPQFHDCVFAEYQVQVQSENTSWQAIELSELEVEVEWSPYLLQPDLPEEGAPKEASIPERLRQDGEKLGLKFGEAARVPNTVKAHCLLLHALESQGRRAQNRVAEVLFRQYHCEGKCPEEAGLGEAREVLMDRRYEQRVREEAAAAARRIPSVPLCVFESGQQLAGAQEVETFLEALKGGSQSSEAPV
ncbi:unnamed protein product [Effrenium voratum]|uniref:SGNH hydrolase-type esterase domain-containing protein n=1 Tax=Effrenium voratum TaxID=2562239 RepID=A0AA36MK55_9DINO|nr:unnamed protein product [Effrenium voratum]